MEMEPIRVLRIVNRFNLGGITYNVSYLSRFLPRDFTTLLIGGPEEKTEASSLHIPESLGLRPLILKEMRRSLNPFADFLAYIRIKKIIRKFRPHIVHTHASKAGALGRLAASHASVPVIVHTFHGHVFSGYFSPRISAAYRFAERFLARRTDAIVAISPRQKKELAEVHRICGEKKISVIRLGFDLERFAVDQEKKRKAFRDQLRINEDVIAVGIIGRLAPVKNHGLFVKAVSECMRASGKKIVAVIVGGGETKKSVIESVVRENRTWTDQPGKAADFVFTGWRKDVDVVLAGLDIVSLTSHNEGTPVSLIEAQVASRFVVSTNVGGVADILDPRCGLLSEPGDRAAYISNLLKAVSELESFSVAASASSQQVIERYSYKRLCSEMEQLYRRLLAEKKVSV